MSALLVDSDTGARGLVIVLFLISTQIVDETKCGFADTVGAIIIIHGQISLNPFFYFYYYTF